MTILLTGASGLVGGAVARAAARRGHRVVGIVGTFAGELEGVAMRLAVDLTDIAAVQQTVLDVFPEVIVNCAAVTAPAECVAEPARSYTLNTSLPAALAQLAHHLSARLIHLSSEQVFDGTCPPYAVEDVPHPINLYAQQKLEAERAVAATAREFAVNLRLPLLLGNSPSGTRSVHEQLFAAWQAGRTPRLYTDEFRQVAHADNVAEVIVELVERTDVRGVLHWAGAELVSRHVLGVRIRDHFKLSERVAPLAATARADTPEVSAQRQPNLALDLRPLAGLLKTRPQTLTEQLDELMVPPPCRAWYLQQK